MSSKKYINTMEVLELTGRPYDEIIDLVKTGSLPAHKSRRGRWRINVDAVEEYFGIQINNSKEDVKLVVTKTSMVSQQDNDDAFVSGPTARKYLKCSKIELENLVDQGVIQAHRDEYRRWKISKKSILDYVKRHMPSSETHLIINENHYREVIDRICAAQSSIKIMTANFKRFRLKPTDNQGEGYKDGTPFVKYLMAKAVQGVSVQIICSRPSTSFTEEWEEYYRQMNPELFQYRFCERNHAKVVIIDDKFAYVGSANVTPAGLGQGIFTPGNFEAGIFTAEPEIISQLQSLFTMIWDGDCCSDCHRADKCKT